MSIAVLAAACGPIAVDDAGCLDVSFPEFAARWSAAQDSIPQPVEIGARAAIGLGTGRRGRARRRERRLHRGERRGHPFPEDAGAGQFVAGPCDPFARRGQRPSTGMSSNAAALAIRPDRAAQPERPDIVSDDRGQHEHADGPPTDRYRVDGAALRG